MPQPIAREPSPNLLTSPDQLDQLMQVTSLRGWIALAGFALLLVTALLLSLVGTVTDTVLGQGVLLRGSGVQPLTAPAGGMVTSFLVHSGGRVEKGEPMVLMTPPGQEPLKVVQSVSQSDVEPATPGREMR